MKFHPFTTIVNTLKVAVISLEAAMADFCSGTVVVNSARLGEKIGVKFIAIALF